MEISIRAVDLQTAPAALFTRTFTVKSRLALAIENEKLTFSIAPVPPYERELPAVDAEYGFESKVPPVVFLAEAEAKPAGRIRMLTWWNQFAYVEDLAVNPPFRGAGVGRRLLEHGIAWARENRFPGVMLETQDDNVPACLLYQSCGFELCGFDRNVYKAIKTNPETALYWYLMF